MVIIACQILNLSVSIHQYVEREKAHSRVFGAVHIHRSSPHRGADRKRGAGLLEDGFQMGLLIGPDSDNLDSFWLHLLIQTLDIWKLQNTRGSEGGEVDKQDRFASLVLQFPAGLSIR